MAILLESGGFLLTETGNLVLLETNLSASTPPAPAPTALRSTLTSLSAAMLAALNAVQAAVTAVGTSLANASLPQLALLQSTCAAAVAVFANAVSTLDSQVPTTSFAGMVVGLPPAALVNALLQTTTQVQAVGYAVNGQNYVNRINANVNAATG